MWKVVAEILNRWLIASIVFHNFLHKFWAGCGTGTTNLEANMLQQIAALRKEVIYVIFLYLHKSYDALDSSRCFYILAGYGVVPQACQILRTNWKRLTMVARSDGYYDTAFKGARGVMQGYPLSPTIFNVVVDVVVQHWVAVMVEGAEERGERGQEGRHQNALFYADDGMVA